MSAERGRRQRTSPRIKAHGINHCDPHCVLILCTKLHVMIGIVTFDHSRKINTTIKVWELQLLYSHGDGLSYHEAIGTSLFFLLGYLAILFSGSPEPEACWSSRS